MLILGTFEVSAVKLACSIDLRQPGESFSPEEKHLYLRDFDFDTQSKQGKIIEYKGMKLLIWGKEQNLFLKLKGGEQGIAPLLIQFPMTSKEKKEKGQNYYFKVGLRTQIYCDPQNSKGKQNKAKLKEMQVDDKLLASEKSIIFQIQDYLTFPHEQAEENGMMRTLFFQNGKIHESSSRLDSKSHWCGLRVQIQEKKSTFMDKGAQLTPLSFQKLQNNSNFDNYSYSFVDFSSGKSSLEQKGGWKPFSLECNIIRGATLHYALFKSITGNKIKISKKINQ